MSHLLIQQMIHHIFIIIMISMLSIIIIQISYCIATKNMYPQKQNTNKKNAKLLVIKCYSGFVNKEIKEF